MRRLAARAAVAAAITVLLSVSGGTAAQAAGQLQVSLDGSAWATTLPDPLFDGLALVPNDVVSASFFVRNGTGQAGNFAVVLRAHGTSDQVIAEALAVHVSADGRNGPTFLFERAADCAVLFPATRLAPGETLEVTTTLTVDDLAPGVGEDGWATLELGLLLREAAPGVAVPDCRAVSTPVSVIGSRTRTIGAGDDATPAPTASASPKPHPSDTADPEPSSQWGAIDANTLASIDSSVMVAAVAAMLLGAMLYFLFLVWRRRRDEDDDDEDQEVRHG